MEKREKIAARIAIIIIIVLLGCRDALQIKLDTKGRELYDIENQLQKVVAENDQLRQELLIDTSLLYINKEARKEGFVDARILYLP